MIPKRYITFINLFLAVLLVAVAGYLFFQIYYARPKPEEAVSVPRVEKPEAVPPPPGEPYYEVIVSRNLWKEKFEAPELQLPPTPKPPPVPRPKLKLLGTSVRKDPSKSSAIIEDLSTRKQAIYQLGDVIGGARIIKIERTRVVLDHLGNQLVFTAFPGQIPVESYNIPLSRAIRKIGENKWLVSKKGLWKIIGVDIVEVKVNDVILQIMKALANVGCRPYYPPGRRRRGDSEGYEVTILPRRHLATHLGVKQGDIIRKINGKMITNKEKALEFLQEAQDKEEVVVKVTREKKLIDLIYIIQEEELEPEEGK